MNQATIFISHAKGRPIVERLEAFLRAYFPGVEVWTDFQIAGGKWSPQILTKLDQAHALVLVGTPTVLGSIYAGFELGYVDKRLGADSVFLLRAGVTTPDLQTRPPLGDFQHYGCEAPDDLKLFLTKLGSKLGLAPKAWNDAELAGHAAEFGKLVKAELEAPDTARIALPRLLDMGQVAVPILPAEANNLLAARKDIDTIQGYLDTMDRAKVGGDLVNQHNYLQFARNLAEERGRKGIPEGNLRARYARLSDRIMEAANELLAGI